MILNKISRHSHQYDDVQFSDGRIYKYLCNKHGAYGAEPLHSIKLMDSVPGIMWIIAVGL